jgi:hypothetical protein
MHCAQPIWRLACCEQLSDLLPVLAVAHIRDRRVRIEAAHGAAAGDVRSFRREVAAARAHGLVGVDENRASGCDAERAVGVWHAQFRCFDVPYRE